MLLMRLISLLNDLLLGVVNRPETHPTCLIKCPICMFRKVDLPRLTYRALLGVPTLLMNSRIYSEVIDR